MEMKHTNKCAFFNKKYLQFNNLYDNISIVQISGQKICRSGEIGRRAGLKIQYWQQCAGSSPAFGTKKKENTTKCSLFYCESY